jgi:hypothetical protein
MANKQNFYGLRPVRHFNGAPWNGQTLRCCFTASNSTAVYLGDPVALTLVDAEIPTDGKAIGLTSATVTDGGIIFGVVTSFEDSEDYHTPYRAALTERYCQVCLADGIVFRIRGNGDGAPSKDWQGLNASMVAGTSSTVTGLSGAGLDETTPSADQSNPLVILHVSDVEDNELAAYAEWDVIINNRQLMDNAAGRYLGVATTS